MGKRDVGARRRPRCVAFPWRAHFLPPRCRGSSWCQRGGYGTHDEHDGRAGGGLDSRADATQFSGPRDFVCALRDAWVDPPWQTMLATNYSFGIERDEAVLARNDLDHRKWSNPLEIRYVGVCGRGRLTCDCAPICVGFRMRRRCASFVSMATARKPRWVLVHGVLVVR